MSTRTKRGFALAAVLWVLTVASVIGAAAALQGRSAFNAGRNRVNTERAFWAAEGCVAVTLATVDAVLDATPQTRWPAVWRRLDALADSARGTPDPACTITLRAMGSAIDVNGAGEQMLRRYFVEATGNAQGDALTDALLDWSDQDSDTRTAGAESDWYDANGRPSPRNDSLVDEAELVLVRGLENRPDLLQYLGVESSPICLTTAPAPVLAALPGFTPDAVTRVLADRDQGKALQDLSTIISRVSPSAAESLLVHFPELSLTTFIEPRVWDLTVHTRAGIPAVTVTTKVWIDQSAGRVVVLRRLTQ